MKLKFFTLLNIYSRFPDRRSATFTNMYFEIFPGGTLLLEGVHLVVSKISFKNCRKYCQLALNVQHFHYIGCVCSMEVHLFQGVSTFINFRNFSGGAFILESRVPDKWGEMEKSSKK